VLSSLCDVRWSMRIRINWCRNERSSSIHAAYHSTNKMLDHPYSGMVQYVGRKTATGKSAWFRKHSEIKNLRIYFPETCYTPNVIQEAKKSDIAPFYTTISVPHEEHNNNYAVWYNTRTLIGRCYEKIWWMWLYHIFDMVSAHSWPYTNTDET
jgi:hypothetical protein